MVGVSSSIHCKINSLARSLVFTNIAESASEGEPRSLPND